jgi:hypothetical protein
MELIPPHLNHACVLHIVHVDTEEAVSRDGAVSVEEEATAISQDVADFDGGYRVSEGNDLTFFDGEGRASIECRGGSGNELHHPHFAHP